MSDLFGYAPEAKPFRDISNQRDSVAEAKAVLCNQLRRLIREVPECVRGGSIQETRRWTADQERALKVMKNTRASVTQLTSAVAQMRSYLKEIA